MLERQGFAGVARRSRTTSTAARRGRRLRAAPDPRRRPGGAALGRDRPARLRVHRAGDDGRRRLREGAAHRAGRARDRRPRPRARRARTRGSSTSRTRSASSPARCSTTGHRAIGLCNVAIGLQRWAARLLGVDARPGARRPGRAQPPHVGARAARRRRATCSRGSSPSAAPRSPPHVGLRAALARRARRDPLLLPPLLLLPRRGRSSELRHAEPARGRRREARARAARL